MHRFFILSALTLSVAVPTLAQDAHAHVIPNPNAKPFGGGENNSDYFMRLSDEAFHEGDYARAITLHRARLAIDPGAIDSYGVAAWLLWSSEKGDEATELMERGVKTNPDDPEMWDEAAQHFDLRKMPQKAAPYFKRALELWPEGEPSQMLRRRYAHAAEKSGDIATSLQVWRGLVKDYPDQTVNKNNLARVEKTASEKTAAKN